jgi:phage tail-like protein
VTQQFEFRLHIKGPETTRVFVIPRGTTTVGRQPGTDLQLNHLQVSRRHAQVDCAAAKCQITDLGSSNGTHVDGTGLTPHVTVPLGHGAVVKIGPFELTVQRIPIEVEQRDKPPPEPIEPIREPEPVPEMVKLKSELAPPAAPPPPARPSVSDSPAEEPVPPGLSIDSRRLLDLLPDIYHTDFMARFLGIFESILAPIEWNVDNFDLYLAPGTAPADFVPWLANWFKMALDPAWSEMQRRTLLSEAHQLYARRGTRWALGRVLEIYTGHSPEISDQGKALEPFTFIVRLPLRVGELERQSIERIVNANKPAHTTYKLEFHP